MRRLGRLLGRLYPRAWRDRYGAEFEALLEDMENPAAADLLDIAQGALHMHILTSRTLAWIGGFAVAGVALGFAAAFVAPPHYRSQSAIRISGIEAASRGAFIDGLAQKVFRRTALAELVKQQGLYEKPDVPLEDVIADVRRDISILQDPAAPDSFVIAYSSKTQNVSKSVVNELVQRFMEENLRAAEKGGAGATLQSTAPAETMPFRPYQALLPAAGLFAGILTGIAVVSVSRLRRRDS